MPQSWNSVPSYLRPYLNQGRLGTSSGVKYDTYRLPGGGVQRADWRDPLPWQVGQGQDREAAARRPGGGRQAPNNPIVDPGNQGPLTPQQVLQQSRRARREQAQQRWQDEYGNMEGFQSWRDSGTFQPGMFRGYDNRADRDAARGTAWDDYYNNQFDAYGQQQQPGDALTKSLQGGAPPDPYSPVDPYSGQQKSSGKGGFQQQDQQAQPPLPYNQSAGQPYSQSSGKGGF